MGVAGALENPTRMTRRLLILAGRWPDGLADKVVPATSYRESRQLPAAQIDEMAAAYRAGSSVQQLSDRFGAHRSTVGRYLLSRGIDTRAVSLRPEQVESAAESYRQGSTLASIAKQYGIGTETARTRLVAAGVVMRPRGRPGQAFQQQARRRREDL